MSTLGEKLSAWVALSRPPFHSVGVLPFILGGVLAWRQGVAFRWDVCAWGTLGTGKETVQTKPITTITITAPAPSGR